MNLNESENFLLSRGNPRNFPSPSTATTSNKVMTNELAQRSPPSVLDRFKALLKQREDELDDEDVPPPSSEEIVQLYEIVLAELVFNSKPLITDLTIIAGEQREHGEGIADAICARILEAPVEHKLPSLYLLDSIVKNIGRDYVRHFSSRLPEVFLEAYREVKPNQHPAMRHLFGTWSTVFPPAVLRKIEDQLQLFSSVGQKPSGASSVRSSGSPQPTHGIHVNPKYLRQLEQSGAETVGTKRLNSIANAGRTSRLPGTNNLHPSSTAKALRPSEVDECTSVGPRRFSEGATPSNKAYDFGRGRAIVRDEETREWRRKHFSDHNMSNGHERQDPRALINAYGNDRGKGLSNNKPLQVERLDVNGMGDASTSWQNAEEEEFDWEDMSPTLADHGRGNGFLPTSALPFGRVGVSDSDSRSGRSIQAQLPLVDNSAPITDDLIPSLTSGHDLNKFGGSRYPQQAWNLPHHSSQSSNQLHTKGRGRNFQMSITAGGVPSVSGETMAPLIGKLPDADLQLTRPPTIVSRASTHDIGVQPTIIPSSAGVWPLVNTHKSQPLPSQIPSQNSRSPFDINPANNVMSHGHNKPSYLPEQQFDSFESKDQNLTRLPQFPNQHPILYQQNQLRAPSSQPASLPPRILMPPLNYGYSPQGHGVVISRALSNPVQAPSATQNRPMTSLQLPGGAFPPFPPGPLPASQMIPTSQNAGQLLSNSNQQQGGAFSGLINSLMAQGLISMTNQTTAQDSVGLEFDADLLKVRHESVINSLYGNLPRQCTTCGLRFKLQEEHSSHMDWHVTRNRMSKNRKQKSSRKWFVSASMWLSGAEALGTDAVPGFLPTETIVEKKEDEELSVPADEDQTACALCGESFDDFYSDETEEWMYRGAVYMNAPSGTIAGMDRSQLGPIVHAKCRSESTVATTEDCQ